MSEHDHIKPNVAWLVTIGDDRAVVYASTMPKARWIAVSVWREVGFGKPGYWPGVTAKRAPELDRTTLDTTAPRAYCENHAMAMAKKYWE